MSCGADNTANTLLPSLVGDRSFELPEVDLSGPEYQVPDGTGYLYVPPVRIDNEDLTTRTVNGSGTFDALMAGIAAHLRKEYEANRITGNQYTEAYTQAAVGAMGNAVQFLLGRDQAFWQAVTAQLQARALEIQVISARVGLEVVKAQLATARLEAANAEATFALTKMKLATEDQQYCLLLAQTDTATYNLENILPEQKKLIQEQIEVQRAQTLDTRSDGSPVAGSVGKQKELYTQQITSYKRDAEVKAAKLFTDAWITQKTLDEGLLAPGAFKNDSVNVILRNIKALNNIEEDPGAQDGDP